MPRASGGWIFFLQTVPWGLCTPCSGRGAGSGLQVGDVLVLGGMWAGDAVRSHRGAPAAALPARPL